MTITSIARILAAVGVLIALSAQAQAGTRHVVKRGTAPVVKQAGGGAGQRAEVDNSDLTCNSNQGSMECAEALKTLCDLGHGGMSSQPGGADECAPPPE